MTHPDAENHGAPQIPSSPYGPDQNPSTGLVVADQALLPAFSPGLGTPAATGPEILTNAFDPIWLLHSLRRHWILATGLGLLFGLVSAALVYWLVPSKATAVALLKVAAEKPMVAFQVDQTSSREDYDTYQKTQLSMITSSTVISDALHRQGISQLQTIQQEAGPDPVVWLQQNLHVSFPREGELMEVSLELENGEDAKRLVEAVVTTYHSAVAFEDQNTRQKALDELTKIYSRKIDEINGQLDTYKKEANDKGQSESEAAVVERDLALAKLTDLRKERDNLRAQQLDAELALKLIKVGNNDQARLSAAVSSQMQTDPKSIYLRQQLMAVQARLAEEKTRAKRADAPSIQRMETEQQQLQRELAQAQMELRRQAQQSLAGSPDNQYKDLIKAQKLRRDHFAKRIESVTQDIDKTEQLIRKLAEQNANLEILRNQLDQNQRMAADMADNIARREVELKRPERITIYQPATVSEGLNWLQRYVLVGLGGVFGFGLTCFVIAYGDFRYRRLNGADQIDHGLGIHVIGTLPPLAFRNTGKDGDPTLAVLMESIDSIRTTLMHADSSKETRVVLVTSATGHEGRSTVASQLAASLARAGRRTLLVDGDLRHPSMHLLFEVPLENGFCEIVRGEVELAEAVRPTHAEGLWLLTSGYCDAQAIQALAKDQMEPLFDKFRNEYDFVIIDSAPVLNLSDSLIMGQYCDGAVLSVLRDVSQVPKVHEANELLRSVGIRVAGVVVNGVHEKPDDRVSKLLLPPADRTPEAA